MSGGSDSIINHVNVKVKMKNFVKVIFFNQVAVPEDTVTTRNETNACEDSNLIGELPTLFP